jgi:ABC-2 type transport system permease protein
VRTATLAPSRTRRAAESQLLAGTGTLLRFALRRDRRRLGIWLLCLGGLVVYTAVVLRATYPTVADRQARAVVMSNPAGVMLGGPGYGTENYTVGAMVANEAGLTVLVAVAMMSISFVVRHTRAEEESGRAELVRAGAVGRRAPLTAALAVAALANATLAAVVTAGLAGTGLAAIDALAFGVGIALTGLVFGAIAAITAEATEHARTASGTALAVLGVAATVRGVGDVRRHHGSALSWFSPIAWPQQTRPFVDLRWWPLLLSVALVAVLLAVAYRLGGRRDTGAGLWPPRPGPAGASALLSSVAGLTVRLQRAAVTGWAVGLVLMGVVYGSLINAVTDMVAGNERLATMLAATGQRSVTNAYVAMMALYVGLLVAAFSVGSVLRARGEESTGRAELLLTTALDRSRFLGSGLAVTVVAVVLLLGAAGASMGLAAAAVSGDAGLVGRLLGAVLVPLPAVLVVTSVAAAVIGFAPRRASLAWGALGWTVLASLFSRLFGWPDWVARLSPFGWLPAVPAERLDVVPLVGLTLVAGALFAVALAGFRRRDISA